MLIKPRVKSINHFVLESVNYRMGLSVEDNRRYQNQMKGFQGEQLFDQLINHSQQNGYVVNDLFLSSKDTHYQMDSILILNEQLIIYEVKNYTGEYCYENGSLFSKNGYSLQNPVDQVNRKKAYLNNWLLNNGYPHKTKAYVVFINPDFYIYNLPLTKSILFVGQLERHFKTLTNANESVNAQDKKLAQALANQHNGNYRPDNLPSYGFDSLKKGILCPECFSFAHTDTREKRICTTCGHIEKIADAIYRSVLEFQVLFPEVPVSMQTIFAWCGGKYTKPRIRRVLSQKMTKYSNGPMTYYKN